MSLKERILKAKFEIITGAIMLIAGVVLTMIFYDKRYVQSGGMYSLMFGPVIAGLFFIVMGLFKKD
jgi:hypothetical protein